MSRDEVDDLVARSRCWFEEDEELAARVGKLRSTASAAARRPRNNKDGGGGASSGWATVPKKTKKAGFKGRAAKPSANGFAGLSMDSSDSD